MTSRRLAMATLALSLGLSLATATSSSATPFFGAPKLRGSSVTGLPEHHATARASTATAGTLKATPQTVTSGETVKFTGVLMRGHMNQKAILQVSRDGMWRKVAYDYTNRQGKFSLKVDMESPSGIYQYRIFGKRSRLYDVPTIISKPVRVTVEARPGSEEMPWRPGQAVMTNGWRFTFGVTLTDAWPALQADSPYSDPPPPGWAFIALPMSITRTGTTSGRAWLDNSIGFVGGDGVVYSYGSADVGGKSYYCYFSDDFGDTPELYPGGTANARECRVVPQTAIAGGRWRLSDDDSPDQFITLN